MRDRTIAIFVKKTESFLELGDLVIGELIGHRSLLFLSDKSLFFLLFFFSSVILSAIEREKGE